MGFIMDLVYTTGLVLVFSLFAAAVLGLVLAAVWAILEWCDYAINGYLGSDYKKY